MLFDFATKLLSLTPPPASGLHTTSQELQRLSKHHPDYQVSATLVQTHHSLTTDTCFNLQFSRPI